VDFISTESDTIFHSVSQFRLAACHNKFGYQTKADGLESYNNKDQSEQHAWTQSHGSAHGPHGKMINTDDTTDGHKDHADAAKKMQWRCLPGMQKVHRQQIEKTI